MEIRSPFVALLAFIACALLLRPFVRVDVGNRRNSPPLVIIGIGNTVNINDSSRSCPEMKERPL